MQNTLVRLIKLCSISIHEATYELTHPENIRLNRGGLPYISICEMDSTGSNSQFEIGFGSTLEEALKMALNTMEDHPNYEERQEYLENL